MAAKLPELKGFCDAIKKKTSKRRGGREQAQKQHQRQGVGIEPARVGGGAG